MWIWITCLILIILCAIYFLNIGKSSDVDKLPGPSIFQLIKFMLSRPTHEDVISKAMEYNTLYGEVVKIWIKPFKPVIITSDPDYVKEVLMAKTHLQKPSYLHYYEPYLGGGLGLLTSAAVWKPVRKMTAHALNQKFLERLLDLTEANLNTVIREIKKNLEAPIDIQLHIRNLLFNVFIESVKHSSVDIDQNLLSNFSEAREKFMPLAMERLKSVHMSYEFIYKHTQNFRDTQEESRKLRAMPSYLVEQHKSEILEDRDSLIADLLAQGMPEHTVRDLINTLIEAGHDTTTSTISFAVYELSRQKDMQNKVLQDSIDILGKNPDTAITVNEITQMKYLKSFVKEVLRCYTIFDLTQRILGAPTQIHGVELPAGTTVIFCAHAMHMSPKYYDNPNVFNPDRFPPENESKLNEFAYLPFLVGPRDCIGKTLALNQVSCAIAKLVRSFEIAPVEQDMHVVLEPTRKSANGVFVKLSERTLS